MLLHGVKKCFGVGVLGGRRSRKDCSSFQNPLTSAVCICDSGAVITYTFAADVSKCGTRSRAFGSTDVRYGAMVDCHIATSLIRSHSESALA